MSKKYWLLILQLGFYVLLIWLIWQRFDELWSSIKFSGLGVRPQYAAAAGLCFLVFYALLAWHWKLICDKYSKYPQRRQWLSFFASQPYKYLPSSIFTFSSRGLYAKKLGLPIKQSSVAQLIENANILASGFAVSALFLLFDQSLALGYAALFLGIAALAAMRLVPAVKIPKTAVTLTGKHEAALLSLALLSWVASGLGFFFITVLTGSSVSFVSAVAANALAVGLGIVAVFAPGGIGVREFIYSKFGIINSAIAMWRLTTLVIDFIVGAIAIILIKSLPSQTERS